MKMTSFDEFYDARQHLISLYVQENNKEVKKECKRLIESLTRIIDKYKKI